MSDSAASADRPLSRRSLLRALAMGDLRKVSGNGSRRLALGDRRRAPARSIRDGSHDSQRGTRHLFIGAVYTALARLHKSGAVSSRVGEPTAKRGGRRKKFYRLEPAGEMALNRAHAAYREMTCGIESKLDAMGTSRGRS